MADIHFFPFSFLHWLSFLDGLGVLWITIHGFSPFWDFGWARLLELVVGTGPWVSGVN